MSGVAPTSDVAPAGGAAVEVVLGQQVPLGGDGGAVAAGTTAAVRRLTEALGLPDAPPVTISEGGTEPMLLVDGRPHVFGTRRLEEAQRVALRSPRGPATAAGAPAFVAELALGPLRRRPDRLLTDATCQRYLELHAGGRPPLAPGTLRRGLAPVLACGISIADGRRILDRLDAALAGGEEPETAAEELIAELRTPFVEVLLAPDAFATVTASGGDDADARRGPAAFLRPRARRGSTASPAAAGEDEPPTIEVFDPGTDPAVRELFALLSDGLFYELGLRVPDVRLTRCDSQPSGTFAVRVHDLTGTTYRSLEPDTVLVNARAEELDGGLPARNPATGNPAAVVDEAAVAALEDRGHMTWDPVAYLVLAVAGELRDRAAALVDMHTVEHDLATLGSAYPELVLATLRRVTLPELTRIIRSLQREGVSVRNLRRVLERLVGFETIPASSADEIVLDDRLVVDGSVGLGPAATSLHRAQFVRNGFRDEIAQAHTRGTAGLSVVDLPAAVAQRLLEHAAHEFGQPDGRRLSAGEQAALHASLRAAWRKRTDREDVVLLTNARARAIAAELLGDALPDLTVLAVEELPPHLRLQHLGSVSLD